MYGAMHAEEKPTARAYIQRIVLNIEQVQVQKFNINMFVEYQLAFR
jgi:hypothetical protein